jgi:DNA polymerase (family 10)
MQNPDIARLFEEVADLLEIQGANPFRVRAYRNAARTILDLADPLAEAVQRDDDLTTISGIGEDLAEKIATIVRTGGLPLHRQLAKQLSPGVLDLLRVPGLGPKRVKLLRSKLKVRSAADLAKALDAGKVAKLPGFGAKMVEKIRGGLGRASRVEKRLLLPEAEVHARAIVEWLEAGGGIEHIAAAGSYRRRRETVGDLDVLVTTRAPEAAMERFTQYADVGQVQASGGTRAAVVLRGGLQVDLRVVEPAAYGAALLYFTGSKAHNVELRQLALDHGYKLNEYGLFKGERRVAGATEEEIYAKLKLAWIPPELREARGEIALAARGALPRLVELDDVRGDLQMHSDASDGVATVREMVDAARQLRYGYVAITDHSKRVSMSGLDPKALRAQWQAIDRLNATLDGFRVLKSVEMDILENGTLDLPDDLLAEADYVVATIHYGLTQTERQITDRLLGAIANPWVDAIGHPTGRIVNKRDPYPLDFDAVARAAAASGCLLELNGSDRMDLPDNLAAAARLAGCRFVLATDAHDPSNLLHMRYAVDLARRAGLTAEDVANTREVEEFLGLLRRHREPGAVAPSRRKPPVD